MSYQSEDKRVKAAHRLLELIFSAIQGQALLCMTTLRLADHLKTRPQTALELADETENDANAMARLLSVLKQLQLLEKDEQARFSCTEMGNMLAEANSPSFFNYAKLTNSDVVSSLLSHMPDTLKTGQSVFNELYNLSFYEALQKRPEDAATFNGAMREISTQDNPEILQAYDFSETGTIMDVGGGEGLLLADTLSQYPHLQASLLELDDVAQAAKSTLASSPVAQRCQIISGNFLVDIPAKADIYILKRVLSHCSDEDALTLLRNIRKQTDDQGKLLIIDPETESLYGASYNLLMLTVVGGKGARSQAELDELFSRSGFRYCRKIALPTELCITEVVPV
ncbi:MAG: hypothetical protein GKR93_15530 [Gammaproteobacteria bacterium]|nr:hypothetical protein [Gammaproteobacteria bacterium]